MEIHFSIDDVIGCFLWITKNNCASIFESRIFAFARVLHERFGVKTTCNCMFSNGMSNLRMVSDKWKQQFQENKDWLKISFHCYDYDSNYKYADAPKVRREYIQVLSELERITGGGDTISTDIRLERVDDVLLALQNVESEKELLVVFTHEEFIEKKKCKRIYSKL